MELRLSEALSDLLLLDTAADDAGLVDEDTMRGPWELVIGVD